MDIWAIIMTAIAVASFFAGLGMKAGRIQLKKALEFGEQVERERDILKASSAKLEGELEEERERRFDYEGETLNLKSAVEGLAELGSIRELLESVREIKESQEAWFNKLEALGIQGATPWEMLHRMEGRISDQGLELEGLNSRALRILEFTSHLKFKFQGLFDLDHGGKLTKEIGTILADQAALLSALGGAADSRRALSDQLDKVDARVKASEKHVEMECERNQRRWKEAFELLDSASKGRQAIRSTLSEISTRKELMSQVPAPHEYPAQPPRTQIYHRDRYGNPQPLNAPQLFETATLVTVSESSLDGLKAQGEALNKLIKKNCKIIQDEINKAFLDVRGEVIDARNNINRSVSETTEAIYDVVCAQPQEAMFEKRWEREDDISKRRFDAMYRTIQTLFLFNIWTHGGSGSGWNCEPACQSWNDSDRSTCGVCSKDRFDVLVGWSERFKEVIESSIPKEAFTPPSSGMNGAVVINALAKVFFKDNWNPDPEKTSALIQELEENFSPPEVLRVKSFVEMGLSGHLKVHDKNKAVFMVEVDEGKIEAISLLKPAPGM